jgi:predicted nucleotidyltransferase
MFEAVFRALNERGVRYLVAGGVAVVLHGYTRLTEDLDLVVDLAEEQARAAIEALTQLGLTARAPVDPRLFADEATRRAWIRDRGMTVLTLHHPDNPMLVVDLFADVPGDFDQLWARAKDVPLETTRVKIVSVDDLIAMKRLAGRGQDLLDIAELERIRDVQDGAP